MASKPKAVVAVRKIRHYKQVFARATRFVWRRDTPWPKNGHMGGKLTHYPAGSLIPQTIIDQMGPAKVRRQWEAHRIEAFEFDLKTADSQGAQLVDCADPTGANRGLSPAIAMKKPSSSRKSRKAAAKKAAANKKGNGRTEEQKKASAAKGQATRAKKKLEAEAEAEAAAAAATDTSDGVQTEDDRPGEGES